MYSTAGLDSAVSKEGVAVPAVRRDSCLQCTGISRINVSSQLCNEGD